MDTFSQFHQRLMRMFFHMKFWHQKLKAEKFGFETFWRKDIGEKRPHKMLVKWTPCSSWSLHDKSSLLKQSEKGLEV